MKLILYFNTLRYLKPIQIIWRLIYRMGIIPAAIKPEVTDCSINDWKKSWCAPSWESITWDGEKQFTFLSVSHSTSTIAEWNCSSREALWNYNLHYLDCLNNQQQLCATKGSALITDWIEKNKDLNGVGWDPYCISLRIINIIKWMSREKCENVEIIHSLEHQALCLLRKIEYHIQANHLFTNAKALVFYGCFLQGRTAEKCLAFGLKLLEKELRVQFNTDGGHYEQSPMYHQILMWDLLDLLLLYECSEKVELSNLKDKLVSLIQKADKWRRAMLHPDGGIAFFNDAAFGVAPPSEAIEAYLKHFDLIDAELKADYVSLTDSGYHIFNIPSSGKLIFDCSNVQPAYQPGHTHADTLSFELSVLGNRWFVNSGTSVYGISKLREFQRSTAAHNTVSIGQLSSSEVWGGFRVAKRAYCKVGNLIEQSDSIGMTASHDGYKRQGLGSEHERNLRVFKNQIIITDTLTPKNGDKATARYYLHPEVGVSVLDTNRVVLERSSETMIVKCSTPISLEKSHWHPRFGHSIPNYCLTADLKDGQLVTEIQWNL